MNDAYEKSKSKPTISIENNSGQGRGIEIPNGIKGWSWGAFLFNWIWAVFNKVWIGLLALVPFVGFMLAMIFIYLGAFHIAAMTNKVKFFGLMFLLWYVYNLIGYFRHKSTM